MRHSQNDDLIQLYPVSDYQPTLETLRPNSCAQVFPRTPAIGIGRQRRAFRLDPRQIAVCNVSARLSLDPAKQRRKVGLGLWMKG